MEEKVQQPTGTNPRRRKKQRGPKWLRTLRKYWPPIRFGLIVYILFALLFLGIAGIVNGCSKNSGENTDAGQNVQAYYEAPEVQLLYTID